MRIGIDARFYGPVGKGLGRYTQEVVDNLLKISSAEATEKNESSVDYVIFLSPDNFDELIISGTNIKKVKVSCRWYGWAEQILFPFYIWKEHLDLMHFPHFNVPILVPVKFVVTIHDLILTRFPTLRATTRGRFAYYFKSLAYHQVIKHALRRSCQIITVSNFTKNDIVQKFGITSNKVVVIYEGVANLSAGRDSLFVAKLDSSEILSQYHIQNNFLLYVGNAYPHKNLDRLLAVFSKLRLEHKDLVLVMVGKMDYFYERIKETAQRLNLWQNNNLNSPVIFAGYVPDAQLEIMYAKAQAYVFPSLYEGFGLPPLEAMAQSCPVVSSNRGALPEILGSAADYFNPEDEADIFSRLDDILKDGRRREELKELGLLQIKKYSWWECARQTLDIYLKILRQ